MAEAAGDIYGPINAETGDESEWDSVTESGTVTFNNTSSNPAHGTYNFRVLYDGSSGTAYGIKTFVDINDTSYHRFYIYIDSSFDINATFATLFFVEILDLGNTVARFGVGSQATSVPSRWVWSYRFTYNYTTTNFSVGTWHYVELKYVRDATVGGVQCWVDGTSLGTDLANDSSIYFADRIKVGDFLGNRTPNNTNYADFDDIKGNTTQIGTYAEALSIPVIINHLKNMRIL